MKKTIKISAFVLSLTLLITASVSVRAEEIPRSSVPQNATEESILITENLISGILDEVSQGLGYLEARSKANNLIYNAVLSGQAGTGMASSLQLRAMQFLSIGIFTSDRIFMSLQKQM